MCVSVKIAATIKRGSLVGEKKWCELFFPAGVEAVCAVLSVCVIHTGSAAVVLTVATA